MQEGFIGHSYFKVIGDGFPLFMIAGLGADHTSWLPLTNYLMPHFKVIIFDNRGIGKSNIPDESDCTVEKMAEDVLVLFAGLGIEQAYLMGHSLGGYVAQQFAAQHPEKIAKLVLLSTKATSQPVQRLYAETTVNMMKQDVPREIIIRNALCWLFSNNFLKDPHNIQAFINATLDKPFEDSRKSYLYQVNALLNFDSSVAASQITTPTLIIAGEQDMLMTAQDVKNLHEKISHSRLEMLEGMGHMSHVEVPEKVASLVSHFLGVPHAVLPAKAGTQALSLKK